MKENDIIRDRYQLLRPLGSGGFGEVWLAYDMKTRTHCAIKFYVRLDDMGRSEFRGEYSRMLGISHPNLLTAKYYDEWQERPFLVLDYCGGGAASGKVGQLSETELWRLIRDVALGLACLHSQRDAQGKETPVIHQDIKPANFLQKGDGTWLISDFGISSRMRSSMSSQSGREVSSGGTIPYMGPERFGQDRMLVKASDIWSIGASIYEMATGDVPFGELGGGTQRAGAEIPHLPKKRWSSDLDRLVSSCLQKETWDRPTAALVAEYADCKLKGKPLPRLPHEKRKPKLWRWMAAAGVVVAVALAIMYWPRNESDDHPSLQKIVSFRDNTIYLGDKAIYKMISVSGGTFCMGAQRDNPNGLNYDSDAMFGEGPVHSVTLSSYYMGETEVTQELWVAVMGSNPSYRKGDNLPVENVSYNDIVDEFLPELNRMTGKSFRLPTEAEWEYAARGGNSRSVCKFAGSYSIEKVAWYYNNARGTIQAVKGKLPNELGLYDMSGNVWEWCYDWYSSKYFDNSSLYNPKGPSSGSDRVLRGGSYDSNATYCRIAYRENDGPDSSESSYGFRLAKTQAQQQDQTSSQTSTPSVSLTGNANGHEWVDLGLPSGLLWATCNVGADVPEEYGDYFAWGETSSKSTYDWSNYKYANGDNNTITKYCNNSDYGNNGFIDTLTILQSGDDPASANWGSGWRTPTKAQWDELQANTINQWIKRNGVKGRLFTAANGNTLFLPAAGYRKDLSHIVADVSGYYWSSLLYTYPSFASYLSFDSEYCGIGDKKLRCFGFSVRPVREK